jgi:hypothetical protein
LSLLPFPLTTSSPPPIQRPLGWFVAHSHAFHAELTAAGSDVELYDAVTVLVSADGMSDPLRHTVQHYLGMASGLVREVVLLWGLLHPDDSPPVLQDFVPDAEGACVHPQDACALCFPKSTGCTCVLSWPGRGEE